MDMFRCGVNQKSERRGKRSVFCCWTAVPDTQPCVCVCWFRLDVTGVLTSMRQDPEAQVVFMGMTTARVTYKPWWSGFRWSDDRTT